MHLYLIRHGESEINLTWPVAGPPEKIDTPLTERGRRQAAALAEWLPHKAPELAAIYASSMQRTLETAGILAAHYDLEVRPDHRVREIGNNAWDHSPLPPEELPGNMPGVPTCTEPFTSVVDHIEHGESWAHLRVRVGDFLHALVAQHSGETIAVVTHGTAQAALIDIIFNVPIYRRASLRSFYTSVSRFEYVNEPHGPIWRVDYLLSTEHLALHGVE